MFLTSGTAGTERIMAQIPRFSHRQASGSGCIVLVRKVSPRVGPANYFPVIVFLFLTYSLVRSPFSSRKKILALTFPTGAIDFVFRDGGPSPGDCSLSLTRNGGRDSSTVTNRRTKSDRSLLNRFGACRKPNSAFACPSHGST